MDGDLCTWIFHHLSEYLDREMQSEVCVQLEEHVKECSSCRALLHTMRGTVDMVHTMPQAGMSEECLSRIRDRVLRGRGTA